MSASSDRPQLSLVVSDVAALVVFVLAGMRSHHGGTYLEVFLRNAIPLLGAWGLTALVLHTYRAAGIGSLLRTWIVAVPAGIVVRSLWVGSPSTLADFATFLVVALVFTLLFLLAGRGLVAAAARLRNRGGAA
jgi:hypothetical protein